MAKNRAWTAEQFLKALSIKAGLGTQGYQAEGASLKVFRAKSFPSGAASQAARGSQPRRERTRTPIELPEALAYIMSSKRKGTRFSRRHRERNSAEEKRSGRTVLRG